jgi:hypothetical protein
LLASVALSGAAVALVAADVDAGAGTGTGVDGTGVAGIGATGVDTAGVATTVAAFTGALAGTDVDPAFAGAIGGGEIAALGAIGADFETLAVASSLLEAIVAGVAALLAGALCDVSLDAGTFTVDATLEVGVVDDVDAPSLACGAAMCGTTECGTTDCAAFADGAALADSARAGCPRRRFTASSNCAAAALVRA